MFAHPPSEADSRPGAPILPFSFLPKSRPIDDLMLFFLLALWSESWLAVVTPSADRLGEHEGVVISRKNCRRFVHVHHHRGEPTHLRNSRWSSSPAPGCVCVILSNRRARGTGGGVESIRASARHSSPSLLFCMSRHRGSVML